MKKKLAVSFALLFLFVGIIASFKVIAGNGMENKTYAFLETKGYMQNDISNIEIKHSFLNKILGYNEWRIFVEFKREPDIIFAFTCRNNEIIKQGVTSDDLLDISEIQNYDNQFENGELKNRE